MAFPASEIYDVAAASTRPNGSTAPPTMLVTFMGLAGSLGVLPRRILVHEDDNREARQLLADAGLAHELRADD